MKVAFFNSKNASFLETPQFEAQKADEVGSQYDVDSFQQAAGHNSQGLEFNFLAVSLDRSTAPLAKGHDAVCIFVNDTCDSEVMFFPILLGHHHPAICPAPKSPKLTLHPNHTDHRCSSFRWCQVHCLEMRRIQ